MSFETWRQNLPRSGSDGDTLYVRSSLVIREGMIVHAELGITDAAAHPRDVLQNLRDSS